MLATTVTTGAVAFVGAVAGVVGKGAVDVWLAHRSAKIDQTKFGADVSAEPAKVVFDAQQSVVVGQQAALVMSESMRHDLRDQVERCQGEIQGLKADNVEQRKRIEVLEEELFDMSERLRREGK